MGVMISPDSELGKEMDRWNKPWRYEHYPLMLYKAIVKPNGQATVAEPLPARWDFQPGPIGDAMWDGACRIAESLSRQCQLTVHSDAEETRAKADGWHLKADEALAAHEAQQKAIGDAAAERHFTDQRMSRQAKADAAVADAATSDHVADVPAPKKRPGRKRKPHPEMV